MSSDPRLKRVLRCEDRLVRSFAVISCAAPMWLELDAETNAQRAEKLLAVLNNFKVREYDRIGDCVFVAYNKA